MILTPVEIKDAVLMALNSVKSSKLRSFLTILGVMIGVSSVIGLASIINGLDAAFNQEIDAMGSNSIMVTKFPFDVDYSQLSEEDRNRSPITIGEAKAIEKNCLHVDGISPQNYYFKRGGNEVKYKNRKGNNPYLMGTWADYLKVNNSSIIKGRFITATDVHVRAMVCVLGYNLAKSLFENENPIGKPIRANGKELEVIGVLEEKKSTLDESNENNYVLMPLSTFDKLHPWEEELLLVVKADTYENIEIAKEEIINTLRVYRKVPFNKGNDFALSTQENLKDFVGNITDYIYIAMIVVTSVGLMVGGIGVMNIMLVSVTERTREIGIRKAIGAKKSNIIIQFLTEAVSLSGAGGIIGVLLGVFGGVLINNILGFPITVSVIWIFIGFFVSVTVGLVSGIYPAYKAAKLDPIEALHYE